MRNILTLVSLVFSLAAVDVSARNLRKEHHIKARQSNSCGSMEIQFGTGLDGNTAPTFKPVNQKDFPHGAATELNIITSFICTRLQSPCNAGQEAVSKCQQVQNSLSGQTGGQAADRWNGEFGVTTNYAGGQSGGNNGNNGQQTTTTTTTTTSRAQPTTTTTPSQNNPTTTTATTTTTPGASSSSGPPGQSSISSTPTTTTSTAAGSQTTDPDGMINDPQCELQAILVTVTVPADSQATGIYKPNVLVPVTGFNALDLGTCTDPTIALGQGLGGRQPNEWAFMNNNVAQFPHGSALDLLTILQFTCNNLVNRCGLSTNSPAVLACNNAETDAIKWGNTGVGADIFNRGMGFSTYYAAVDGS